jgi:tetratricopeptide (TPR) repeat protein
MLTGRLREAEAEMRRALELDPLSPMINANIGMCFYVARQYDAAMTHWQKALERHLSGAGSWEVSVQAHIYGRMGHAAEGGVSAAPNIARMNSGGRDRRLLLPTAAERSVQLDQRQ